MLFYIMQPYFSACLKIILRLLVSLLLLNIHQMLPRRSTRWQIGGGCSLGFSNHMCFCYCSDIRSERLPAGYSSSCDRPAFPSCLSGSVHTGAAHGRAECFSGVGQRVEQSGTPVSPHTTGESLDPQWSGPACTFSHWWWKWTVCTNDAKWSISGVHEPS